MTAGPRLEFAIDSKRFTGSPALFEAFGLSVEGSSVVAIVGPSGVGKSTLLRLAAGIDTDFAGSITIDGQPAAASPPPGFVFQDARLLPWLTASANIGVMHPETSAAEAESLLMRVGLAGSAGLYPHQLSGGMQRRVALARAISVNPRLLLLDEPFVSLDRALVGDLEQVLLTLIETTRPTVLLVTHMPEDAAALADRAVVLAGRPARIVADYRFDTPAGQRSRVERELIVDRIRGATGAPVAAEPK